MTVQILQGDCRDVLATLPDNSVHCCVTSPPYFGLRSYLSEGHSDKGDEIGLEPTPDEYVASLVDAFRGVRRVLSRAGTLWLNIGDSYHNLRTHMNGGTATNTVHRGGARDGTECFARANRNKKLPGLKDKDLIGIPWRAAFALQADGWWLRSAIVARKRNPMPEKKSLDRPLSTYEMVFLMTKSATYEYAASNRDDLGNVWDITVQSAGVGHFATMAPELAQRCILSSTVPGQSVLDPFGGAGTTGLVADRCGRNAILIELNREYADIARNRINGDAPLFGAVA